MKPPRATRYADDVEPTLVITVEPFDGVPEQRRETDGAESLSFGRQPSVGGVVVSSDPTVSRIAGIVSRTSHVWVLEARNRHRALTVTGRRGKRHVVCDTSDVLDHGDTIEVVGASSTTRVRVEIGGAALPQSLQLPSTAPWERKPQLSAEQHSVATALVMGFFGSDHPASPASDDAIARVLAISVKATQGRYARLRDALEAWLRPGFRLDRVDVADILIAHQIVGHDDVRALLTAATDSQ